MKLKEILKESNEHGLLKGVVLIMPTEADVSFDQSHYERVFAFRHERQAQAFYEKLTEIFDDSDQICEIHQCEVGVIKPAWVVTWTDGLSTEDDVIYYAWAESEEQLKEDFGDELHKFMYEHKILEESVAYLKLDEDFDYGKDL